MFESNKIIQITGDDEDDLKRALDFCFALNAGGSFNGVPNMFHVTKEGSLILGYGYSDECFKNGWSKYPFTVNAEILTHIILQHLKEQKYTYGQYGDGSTCEGWKISSPHAWSSHGKTLDIYNYWFNAIVIIEPYVTFYDK